MVRDAGLGGSAPKVARWLGDIRSYFPTTVVRVMQSDAMERLGLRQLLLEPELLEVVEPDVSLVATLVALNRVIPDRSRETARTVVRAVTAELERRLAQKTRTAVAGALNRGPPALADPSRPTLTGAVPCWPTCATTNPLPQHHPRTSRRLQPAPTVPAARRHLGHRPERLNGSLGWFTPACSAPCWPA